MKNNVINKHNFLLLSFSISLAITGCKKLDIQKENTKQVTVENQQVAATKFQSITKWESEAGDGFTTYSSVIQDSAITSNLADSGMVLVFKRKGNVINALPYNEGTENNASMWYYQVSENKLTIIYDAYSEIKNLDPEFTYCLLTEDKLNTLNSKGYSKNDLMKLTYEDLLSVLK